MYNEALKDRFAREFTTKLSIRQACAALFEATARYEESWGADICTRSAEELRPVLTDLLGMRTASKYLRLNILREYAQWCMAQNVPGACDGLLNANTDGLDKLRKQTVKNPLHLQRYLDAVFAPESEQTMDNTMRFYYWMAYSGVREADIFRLTAENMDFSTLTVRLDGKSYPLYPEALPCIKNCAELNSFAHIHPYQGVDRMVWRERVDGDLLIRGTRSVKSVDVVRSMVSRRAKQALDSGKTELKLSYGRVWLSGVFYRTYMAELAGDHPDFNSVAADVMADREYRLESGRNTIDAKRRVRAAEYAQDYRRWKMTL